MKISMSKAMAQANSFGFPKTQARPKAPSSQKFGPAFFGLAWLGFWLKARAGTSLLATSRLTLADVSEDDDGQAVDSVLMFSHRDHKKTELDQTRTIKEPTTSPFSDFKMNGAQKDFLINWLRLVFHSP